MCEQCNWPRKTDMKRQLCSKFAPQKTVHLMLLASLYIAETGQNMAETARIFC